MKTLPAVETLIDSLAAQIAMTIGESNEAPPTSLAVIGLYTGGIWVAEKLIEKLALADVSVASGSLAVTLQRDDFQSIGLHRQSRPSKIDFDVTGMHVILVDDVLYTGRTIRAALNELFEFGRPAKVSLACLVDRGGRQLPIAPDYCAFTLNLAPDQELVLEQSKATKDAPELLVLKINQRQKS
jgi:pyrimidine operon attenuation protein / uracil phosphoribosyltransferase